MTRRLWAWVPVLVWVGVIVFVLTQTVPRPLQPLAGPGTAALAHVFLFFVLGMLVRRALDLEGFGPGAAFLVGLAGCAALGVATEIAQMFAPSRYASPFDVVYDIAGAAFGLWVGGLLLEALRPPRRVGARR